jgi:hypothetical protein
MAQPRINLELAVWRARHANSRHSLGFYTSPVHGTDQLLDENSTRFGRVEETRLGEVNSSVWYLRRRGEAITLPTETQLK